MEVKTGNLRNNLSRYLKRVQQTGDTLVVLDRNKPVAEIHPYRSTQPEKINSVWAARRQMEKQAGSLDEDFELPIRSTSARKHANPLD